MRQNEITEFLALLEQTATAYNKPRPDTEVAEVWVQALKGYSLDRVKRAMRVLWRTSKHMPRPAELVAVLDEDGMGRHQFAACCYVDSDGRRCTERGRLFNPDAEPATHFCHAHWNPDSRHGPAVKPRWIDGAPPLGIRVTCMALLDHGRREAALDSYGPRVVAYCEQNAAQVRALSGGGSAITRRLQHAKRHRERLAAEFAADAISQMKSRFAGD